MTPFNFQALLVEQNPSAELPTPPPKTNQPTTLASIVTLSRDRLPVGDVTIQVAYSSLNYKDALAYQGHRGIVKKLPHIPGIDAAGIVIDSSSELYRVGDHVLVTGYDLGQGHWGAWSELIRVPAEWIVPLPNSLSPREAMIYGTAGFTAAQSVMALQRNDVSPAMGEVVVTGATGGVGSLAVRLLSHQGYEVVAVTGKADQHDALLACGAKRVIGRTEIADDSTRPLLSATWAGAIDTVGGPILQSLLRSTRYGGCVTACGLVAGAELSMTVYPFLLRGVSLCGIASGDCPMAKRRQIWELLAGDWKPENLNSLVTESKLEQLPDYVDQILAGKIVGRVAVKIEP